MNKISLFNIVIILLTSLYSCSSTSDYRQCNGATWGTTFHIVYKADHDLNDSILHIMRQIELSLSPFCDSSKISRINRNEQSVITDSLIENVFLVSQEICQKSDGAFDPTIAPIINLWGFGYDGKKHQPPTQEQIDSILPIVGINDCRLTNHVIEKKHAKTEFNFSAITKGYGCDIIGNMLKRNNCHDYMVEIGGEIALSGVNSNGEKWHIMIDAPIKNDSTITHSRLALVEVSDCGIATSGNYRNFVKTQSGSFGHTINPADGYPVSTSTLCATIIAPTAMRADALATACMAMPIDKAAKMIENETGTSALLVYVDSISRKWTMLKTSRFPQLKQ